MLNININTGRNNFVKYDESLLEVYVLDYDDNYHRDENAPTTEFEREVRKIKARYRDISKYNGAVSLYSEYMEYLENKHGGPELFKIKNKAGLIDDYIPPKPRIKNTKELRFLKKNKIIIGTVGRFLIDDDELDSVIDMYSDDMNLDNITIEHRRDKNAEKLIDDDTGMKKYRNIGYQSFRTDVDFLDYYFKNKNINSKNKKNGKKNKKTKKEKILISDLMRSDYEDHFYSEDEYMGDSDQSLMLYNNLLLSTGTVKELDVYHKLNDVGWNSYKLMKQGEFGSRVTNIFKPPKKKKKNKKNKSKYDGKYDGLLIDIMTDNGFDMDDMDNFEDFQKEMLNMTSSNVFK